MLKILLIDDDEIVLLVQRKLLQRCGFNNEILSYRGGETALNYLAKANSNEHFLILLDINMPKMNGWQFLKKLSQLEVVSRTYVIMVTSSIDKYDKEAAEEYSCVIDFIEKPITVDNCTRIRSITARLDFF